ncbi:hypothetical protein F2Q68_00016280 [Brassica cretica]|uniref:Uncharacterized protein n=1 Tax=Brassica cretica TaxID=69181 RepID=A0A8S9HGA7_BRACR|nr:hypothetical protein F2Q68_00016280 [Brassica cretica]KAF3589281.1 hypothetical protein F2Q69_00030119 [Brassica cretica]
MLLSRIESAVPFLNEVKKIVGSSPRRRSKSAVALLDDDGNRRLVLIRIER